MRKYQMSLWVFIASTILAPGFKKNIYSHGYLSEKSVNTTIGIDLPELMIANATTVQSDKGQTPVEILVCLTQATSEPVTMEYRTENGTAIAGVDYVATKGSIRFDRGEVAKWITVFIVGEVAADPDEDAHQNPDDDFKIVIDAINGAYAKKKSAIITIINNHFLKDPRMIKAGTDQAIYEVRMVYNGYTTLGGDLTNCPVRRNGYVLLTGILKGYEKVNRDDPVLYTGTLLMSINIDICSVERLPNGEDKFCALQVSGMGDVITELEMDSATGYGYIKIHDAAKNDEFIKTVGGDCFSQIGSEWQMVPDESISSVFNGRELPMLIDVATGRPLQKLRKGVYSETDKEGNLTRVEVIRKIR